jgi:hypothetical protein
VPDPGSPVKTTPLTAYRGVLEVLQARVLVGASAVFELGDWLYNLGTEGPDLLGLADRNFRRPDGLVAHDKALCRDARVLTERGGFEPPMD